jgi:hypothetical protein
MHSARTCLTVPPIKVKAVAVVDCRFCISRGWSMRMCGGACVGWWGHLPVLVVWSLNLKSELRSPQYQYSFNIISNRLN